MVEKVWMKPELVESNITTLLRELKVIKKGKSLCGVGNPFTP